MTFIDINVEKYLLEFYKTLGSEGKIIFSEPNF